MKHVAICHSQLGAQVASFAGAWIETCSARWIAISADVASFAGAWIETFAHVISLRGVDVASFAGAWIETSTRRAAFSEKSRRLLRGGVD